MKFKITPKIAAKPLIRLRPEQHELINFKEEFFKLITNINDEESEEHEKNNVRDFLKKTFYANKEINTKDKKDMVISAYN